VCHSLRVSKDPAKIIAYPVAKRPRHGGVCGLLFLLCITAGFRSVVRGVRLRADLFFLLGHAFDALLFCRGKIEHLAAAVKAAGGAHMMRAAEGAAVRAFRERGSREPVMRTALTRLAAVVSHSDDH